MRTGAVVEKVPLTADLVVDASGRSSRIDRMTDPELKAGAGWRTSTAPINCCPEPNRVPWTIRSAASKGRPATRFCCSCTRPDTSRCSSSARPRMTR